MLRFEELSKSYGARTIFDAVSFEFGAGVYALQGPNGIGKSTLLTLLAGAIPADSGDVWVAGQNLFLSPTLARRSLSYVPDESPVYPFMRGQELLEFVAKAKKCAVSPEVQDLARSFGLDSHRETCFGVMSLGTQKKFLLCAAWIGDPQVFLLDEPSNGLDLAARAVLAERLCEAGRNSTIVFTSHDADFVNTAGATIVKMDQILSPA